MFHLASCRKISRPGPTVWEEAIESEIESWTPRRKDVVWTRKHIGNKHEYFLLKNELAAERGAVSAKEND